MEDLISRQAAIDEIEKMSINGWVKDAVIDEVKDLPSAQPNCTDCIQNGGDFDCDHVHCHKGARLDGYTEQIRWERDIAIQQLKELGYEFGEDTSGDPKVIRCKDCKHFQNGHICQYFSRYGTIEMKPDDFCSRAERREDEA